MFSLNGESLLLLILVLIGFGWAEADPFALRVSCGARNDLRAPPGRTLWHKDFAYTGGRVGNVTSSSPISPPLKTLRYFPLSDGPENCYHLRNIPLRHYSVRFFFAITDESNGENEPIFDVSVEGTQVHSLKPGWSSVPEQSFVEGRMFATDSIVSCCFHGTGHGDPSIMAIEVLEIDEKAYFFPLPKWKEIVLRTVRRLTCGNGSEGFDEDMNGNLWGGNRFWSPIKTFGSNADQIISTKSSINGASDGPNFYPEIIYQSAIVSAGNDHQISFQMEVDPNKDYSLWLHFAEIDPTITGKGQRVFDVLVNDAVIFKNVDIVGMTGKSNTALVLNRTLTVSSRTLTIVFHPAKGSHAIINAIEVLEVIPAEFKTHTDEVRALEVIKNALGLPHRFGWNGDPCVPQQHPWGGVDCQFNKRIAKWVIDGLGLDNQGLRGFLPSGIGRLRHLQTINLSGNSIHGSIPDSLGTISTLEKLDLSYNMLNGSIPESLGRLKHLKILNLNGNLLSGRVPALLGGLPLHGASINFTGNDGLCGIPGLPSCGPHLGLMAKIGIAIGSLLGLVLLATCLICWRKRRQNILRAQQISTAREASYAKARTQFSRDMQMSSSSRQSSWSLVNASRV